MRRHASALLSTLTTSLCVGLACSGTLEGATDTPGGAAGTINGGGGEPGTTPDSGAPSNGGTPGTGDGGVDPTSGAPNGGSPSLANKTGAEVYQLLCASCHGPAGEGTALGPELQHPVPDFSSWVVRNGRDSDAYPGPMLAYADTMVTDQQLEEIWTWLGNLPQPTTGEALYLDYCANCHGADASGGRVSKDIKEKGNALPDLTEKVRQGAGGTTYGSALLYMPHWDTDQISADDLALIANYLTSL